MPTVRRSSEATSLRAAILPREAISSVQPSHRAIPLLRLRAIQLLSRRATPHLSSLPTLHRWRMPLETIFHSKKESLLFSRLFYYFCMFGSSSPYPFLLSSFLRRRLNTKASTPKAAKTIIGTR